MSNDDSGIPLWGVPPAESPDSQHQSGGQWGQQWLPQQGTPYPPPSQPGFAPPSQPMYPPPGPQYYGQPSQPLYPGPGAPAGPSQPLYPGMPSPPSGQYFQYAPGQPYPYAAPPGYPLPQPKTSRKMTWWKWVLATVAGLALVFVLFGGIPTLLSGLGAGNHLELGLDYTQSGSSFQVVDARTSFHASDPFAYVITLARPLGTTSFNLALAQEFSGGAESVVYTVPVAVANPGDTSFANKVQTTDSIMDNYPPGMYVLEMFNGNTLLAQATFTYLG